MTWVTDGDAVPMYMHLDLARTDHGPMRKIEMDGSAAITAITLDRNDGATRTYLGAVGDYCCTPTLAEFDEVTDAGSSKSPHMTWVIEGDTVQWCMIWI